MQARYFRYLFENQDDGLFHSGSIYDNTEDKSTNYIYMAGGYCGNLIFRRRRELLERTDTIPRIIDIMIVGGYTAKYIRKLISILRKHEIKTIVLPYLAPIQRLVLVEEMGDGGETGREGIRFLQDPYLFLKNAGIGNIFFLYGNGAVIYREPEELERGCHFELADMDSLRLIREMEGHSIPVVKAGYIVENGWLFYFGVYGVEIQVLSNFTRDYFSHLDNINEISPNLNEDYVNQMKNLIQKYLRKFGTSPTTTIVMFEGPLNASPRENDSFMAEKEFDKKAHCEVWNTDWEDGTSACSIHCLYNKDYDIMQHHKNRENNEPRFGMLMLGNANLNCYYSEIISRFWKVRLRVRGVGVPNCGSNKDWNGQILNLSSLQDRIYWICNKHEMTSAGVVNDIVLSSPNNRLLIVDENNGSCFSGYLIPKDDVEI